MYKYPRCFMRTVQEVTSSLDINVVHNSHFLCACTIRVLLDLRDFCVPTERRNSSLTVPPAKMALCLRLGLIFYCT